MKSFLLLALSIVFLIGTNAPQRLYADGGKWFITHVDPQDEVDEENLLQEEQTVQKNGVSITSNDDPLLALSPPVDVNFMPPDTKQASWAVTIPEQRIVLAWNGRTDLQGEALLLINPFEKATLDAPLLTVIPLPGPVKALWRLEDTNEQQESGESGESVGTRHVGLELFRRAKEKMIQKWDAPVGSGEIDFPLPALSPVQEVFVQEADGFAELESGIKKQMAIIYRSQASVDFQEEDQKIMEQYFSQGFRHFVCILGEVRKTHYSVRAPFVIRFQSRSAFVPLLVGRIGTHERTMLDLLILTPHEFNSSDILKLDPKTILLGKGAVEWSTEELAELGNEWGELMTGCNRVFAYNLLIKKDIKQFSNDFIPEQPRKGTVPFREKE